MTDDKRSVRISRTGPRTFAATNRRGGTISFGEGQNSDFSPVELLLVAIVGCSAVDIDYVTTRRSEPTAFEASASALKLADDKGNHLGDVALDFQIDFPEGPAGDRARTILDRVVAQSRDRLCTVSRTVQLPTEVGYFVNGREVRATPVADDDGLRPGTE